MLDRYNITSLHDLVQRTASARLKQQTLGANRIEPEKITTQSVVDILGFTMGFIA